MAGMLPGVEMARRRRITHHSHHQYDYSHCDYFFRYRIQSSSTATTTTTNTTMDVTALKARTRLEEKLGSFRPRWNNKHQTPQPAPPPVHQVRSSASSHVLRSKQIHRRELTEVCRNTTTTTTPTPKKKQLSRRNSEREFCAVCLEELLQLQLQGRMREVTNLACSHRYHSDCLLPWLASHSHCPCCRSLIHSL